jgi:phage-related baseplate assembly protein
MVNLSDLLRAPSRAEVYERLLALYKLAGFPIGSWGPTNVARYLTEAAATVLADLAELITSIARGGYLDHAEKAWLDLLAKSVYWETRKSAVSTRGLVRIEDYGAQGPHEYRAGTLWVGTRDGRRRFRNVELVTVPLAGSVDATFEADTSGADWNVAAGVLTEVLAPGGTGLRVSNPATASGTWITQQGADIEGDEAFRQRCRDKWATLGSGAHAAAYRYHAASASPEVTRVRLTEDRRTGRVTVVVASGSGPISAEALMTVAARLDRARPLCVEVALIAASGASTPVKATLFLAAGTVATDVEAGAAEAVAAYARTVEIGGRVHRSRLIGALVGVPGVVDVALELPASDVELPATSVVSPALALAFTRAA